MHLTALVLALLGCVAAVALGGRFLVEPRQATLAFGIAPDDVRGLAYLSGVRNITSAAVLLAVWAAAGSTPLGWALIATALTPAADAIIVVANGGTPFTALSRHGVSAILLIIAGLVLALESAT
ncbi:DUF4267 domain-containing protein [Mycolicibacterium sp. CBMA 226]|uniref:DUF4267 domain-containing protein n=1 Tax=Mycolicibacterium sp. CBMA 226 TaxID=2606611 RepID=UPI0012DC2318|nr:DUF4267 domain-containing protein [Mycolicibacterium sp. CBMA 226]MUL77020.1 DUF4267 domain-containing protein [Mycolicibacterium sp. CBMA 226]